MKARREWAMPNKNTFDIPPIWRLVSQYCGEGVVSVDPFANSNKFATITNDLDDSFGCDYNMDALDFVRTFGRDSVDVVLFDPPYSPRQVSEVYKRLGRTVNFETTQASFWAKIKKEIARIVKPTGYVLCFGWNSNGIGLTRGFAMIDILIVAHGGHHNDTICTVEQKNLTLL